MLSSIFKMIIKPIEVKVTCSEIKSSLDRVAGISQSTIETKAISIAEFHAEQVEKEIRIDGKKPDELALRIINDAIRDNLLTGEFHMYRGYLDSIGVDMLKVLEASMSDLCEKGYITYIDAEEYMERLNDQIAEIG